jgi:ABC-type spermidine/putrescine transport system permease subunit II
LSPVVRRLLAAWMTLVAVFLYLPLLMVFANAFNSNETLVGWGGFTTKWFSQALSDSQVVGDAKTSMKAAIACVILSLAIAIPAGLWARGASRRERSWLDATTYMRIALPEIVFATGFFILFTYLGLPFGLPAIILGHVVIGSAFALVIIQARLATMGTTLEEAAADLGAPPLRTFRRVTLPLLAPAIAGAAMFAFIASADNILVSMFMGGSAAQTLPVYILAQTRFVVTPETNAIGALFVVVVIAVLFLGALVVARLLSGVGLDVGLTRRGRRRRVPLDA